MDVLCLGAAVLDIIARPVPDQSEWGEKQRIQSIRMSLGGDAANQSVRLADMGISAALVTCLGADENGEILRSRLKERGVEDGLITWRKDTPTGVSLVLVNETGDRHIFSVMGAHALLGKQDLPGSEILPKAISLGSLFLMPELEKDGLAEYLASMKARGVLVFADLAPDKFRLGSSGIKEFLPYIDYFLPSHKDVLLMSGKETTEEAALYLRDLGAHTIVIKCAEKGACILPEGERTCVWVPALPVKTVDVTGAGDSMDAFFISRILKGDSLIDAVRFACIGASLTTLHEGACSVPVKEAEIRQGTVLCLA